MGSEMQNDAFPAVTAACTFIVLLDGPNVEGG